MFDAEKLKQFTCYDSASIDQTVKTMQRAYREIERLRAIDDEKTRALVEAEEYLLEQAPQDAVQLNTLTHVQSALAKV